jgi:phospholipase C
VPTVLVSPWIEAGTVARPKGDIPFDHTSVIATVTRRFGLEPLTYRDQAAPDLGCVLTLTQPRADKPAVSPLDWDTPGSGRENDLQAIVADVLSHLTGTERPTEQQLDEYIHEAYQLRFGGPARERRTSTLKGVLGLRTCAPAAIGAPPCSPSRV